jgi:hypothetical protein
MDVALPILLFIPEAARFAIGVALGLGAIVTAAFYMIAYTFQHAPIFAVAKEELSALIFSAIIVVFWIGSGITIDPLVYGILSPFQAPPEVGQSIEFSDITSSHVQLSLASLEILFHKLKEMYTSMYLFEALIGFLSTISFPLAQLPGGTSIISFTLMPFDGLVLLSNAHTIVVESIGHLMTVIWAKEFVLIFARDVIPIIFFPLGLVFRAIPFLRTTGSSIIAICFAGYFVLPLAILFSNALIFDIYDPLDSKLEFTYSPNQLGPYSAESDLKEDDVKTQIDESKKKGTEVLELFTARNIAESGTSTEECEGNAVSRMFCSAGHVIWGVIKGIGDFFVVMFTIWTFMMGLTGDFLSFWTNPIFPASAMAGLYHFIIDAVIAHGQFLIVVLVTSLFEIIFTITMYRNISMLIGGELEIAGLSKLV